MQALSRPSRNVLTEMNLPARSRRPSWPRFRKSQHPLRSWISPQRLSHPSHSSYNSGSRHPHADVFSDGKSLVTFIVGPDPNPTEFLVHKEVVCQQSEVLAAAFNSGFKEGQTQTYRLEDTTDRAFRLFMQWLYSRKFTLLQLRPDHHFDEKEAKTELELAEDMSLVELWVLADKFRMSSLQNATLDAIDDVFSKPFARFPTETYQYLCRNTIKGSPLRQYMIAICAEQGLPSLLHEDFEDHFPRELLLELCGKLLEDRQDHPINEANVSEFFV